MEVKNCPVTECFQWWMCWYCCLQYVLPTINTLSVGTWLPQHRSQCRRRPTITWPQLRPIHKMCIEHFLIQSRSFLLLRALNKTCFTQSMAIQSCILHSTHESLQKFNTICSLKATLYNIQPQNMKANHLWSRKLSIQIRGRRGALTDDGRSCNHNKI